MNDGVFTRCKFCRSRMRMKTFVAWPFCPRPAPREAAQRQETRNCLLINVTKKIAQRNESGGGEKGR